MMRDYLKGIDNDMINILMAGAKFNIIKMLRKIREFVICFLNELLTKLFWNFQMGIIC